MDLMRHTVQMSRIIEVLVVTLVTLSISQYSEDTCDWILWDSAEDVSGVRTVKPSCSEGSVQWKHPYGAIRVAFIQYEPFELCFIAMAIHTTVKISREQGEGLERVTVLSEEGGRVDQEICVESGQNDHVIVIYIESVLDTSVSSIGYFALDYDVQKNSDTTNKIGMQDCKPCSDKEIVEAVCNSDFVLKGEIAQVAHFAETGESHVHISTDKIHRQTHPLFTQQASNNQAITNADDKNTALLYTGHVIVPHKCRTSKGNGRFLFMGRVRLKRPHLVCAPRYEVFQRLWKDALRRGSNNCVLG